MHIQHIDGIPYKLNAPHDFTFMAKYDTVFKIFDEQGSGNISFGYVALDFYNGSILYDYTNECEEGG